jgi:hypothetical protein
MDAWQEETTACQEAMEACLEKAKANPGKMKTGLEEMEAMVETGLEEMKARMDVFKERLKKMEAMHMEANTEETESGRA